MDDKVLLELDDSESHTKVRLVTPAGMECFILSLSSTDFGYRYWTTNPDNVEAIANEMLAWAKAKRQAPVRLAEDFDDELIFTREVWAGGIKRATVFRNLGGLRVIYTYGAVKKFDSVPDAFDSIYPGCWDEFKPLS